MILERLNQQECFTETEKTIANYILDSNNSIVGMTSSRLGKETFTSQSAVVRLYKKLGIENYRIFYTLILEEKNIMNQNGESQLNQNVIKNDMGIDDIIDTVGKVYINEINYLKTLTNKNTIQRIYNRLRSSKIVNIYTMGYDSMVAKEMMRKISGFDIYFHHIETMSEFKNMSLNSRNSVSIMISLDEDNEVLNAMAKVLAYEDTYIFGIIGNMSHVLKKYCQDYVVIDFNNISKSIGAFLVIDMIHSMFISNTKKQ